MTANDVPKVSVVIVFLNGANFIQEAIDSVFAQTFADWELVFVDDGSTDESSAIARDLAARDHRVTYVDFPGHENRGLAAGRILGADRARGKYLLFLDHDDLLYPQALERLHAALDIAPDAGAVFAAVRYWAYDDVPATEESIQSFALYGDGMVSGRTMLRDLIHSDYRHPAICSSLFRRTAFLAARELRNPFDATYEDTAILFRLLSNGDACTIDEPLSDYRMHCNSMCQRAKAQGSLADDGFSPDREKFLLYVLRSVRLDAASRLLVIWVIVRDRFRHWISE